MSGRPGPEITASFMRELRRISALSEDGLAADPAWRHSMACRLISLARECREERDRGLTSTPATP